jgi:stress response protein YsnF
MSTRENENDPDQTVEVTAHQERTVIETEVEESGRLRVKKHVETVPVEQVVPRSVEHVDTSQRSTPTEGDTGEVLTLEDGSVSIPIFEEVLVVTKKLVVRERIIVRKETVVDEYVLRTELRREHATVEADDSVDLEDRRTSDATDPQAHHPRVP